MTSECILTTMCKVVFAFDLSFSFVYSSFVYTVSTMSLFRLLLFVAEFISSLLYFLHSLMFIFSLYSIMTSFFLKCFTLFSHLFLYSKRECNTFLRKSDSQNHSITFLERTWQLNRSWNFILISLQNIIKIKLIFKFYKNCSIIFLCRKGPSKNYGT